jgi:CDP-6-deoxy-D-xylo-4-hexulose-3-dehydrase
MGVGTLTESELRTRILELVGEYHKVKFAKQEFVAGDSPVRYAGRVFDEEELQNLVDSSLDFWLTEGRYAEEFQAAFAEYVGIEYAILTNSGSSANLLAFTALTSPLMGDKRLKAGDEVISVAAGFPTTLNPVIQNGMIPVFVDVEIGTYNAIPDQIREAITPKTRAIFLAHTLGNPYDLDAIMELVEENELWLIEDCSVSVKEDVTFIRLFDIETSWSPETGSNTPQFALSTFGAPSLESVQDASSRLRRAFHSSWQIIEKRFLCVVVAA